MRSLDIDGRVVSEGELREALRSKLVGLGVDEARAAEHSVELANYIFASWADEEDDD